MANITNVLFGGKDLSKAVSLTSSGKTVAQIKLGDTIIWPLNKESSTQTLTNLTLVYDTFDYNGYEINAFGYLSCEEGTGITVDALIPGDTYTATEPGVYTFYVDLRPGYCWEDGTSDRKWFTWEIKQPNYNYILSYTTDGRSASFYWDTNNPNPETPEISASLVSGFDVLDIGVADIDVNGNYVEAYKSSDAWINFSGGSSLEGDGYYNTDPIYNVCIDVYATDPNGYNHTETIYLTAYSRS